jgi:hypothetical protein
MTKEDRRSLQMALNEKCGKELKIDGDFGPASCAVLKEFQLKSKLVVSGLYDDATHALLDPFIRHKYLTQADYQAASGVLGCEVPSVKAVVQVEADGDGFLPDGRPDILFERHQFYRHLLKKMPLAEVDKIAAANPDICSKAPGGYKGGKYEYPRLERARAINRWAADMATSWGMFQIMGFNFATAGYASVDEFIAAAYVSERDQLNAFLKFVKADTRLLNAIRLKQWAAFAHAYNGANYSVNKYDIKLADAYKFHQQNPNG